MRSVQFINLFVWLCIQDGRTETVDKTNGATLKVDAGGTQTWTTKEGMIKVTSPSGYTCMTKSDGAKVETFPKDAKFEIEFPLGPTPGGKTLDWPKIKKVHKPATGSTGATHYLSSKQDGIKTEIQANQDGNFNLLKT